MREETLGQAKLENTTPSPSLFSQPDPVQSSLPSSHAARRALRGLENTTRLPLLLSSVRTYTTSSIYINLASCDGRALPFPF